MRLITLCLVTCLAACGSNGASPSGAAADTNAVIDADDRDGASDAGEAPGSDADADEADAADAGQPDGASPDVDEAPDASPDGDTPRPDADDAGGPDASDTTDAADADSADAIDAADADVADAFGGDAADADALDSGPDAGDLAPVVDIEGNEYRVVRIGDQVWMAENLRVTRFNDGTPIGEWVFGNSWFAGGETPLWQWADTSDLNGLHDEELPEDYFGAMYNEAALASGRLAPEGWRIPTPADFEALEAFLIADGQEGNVVTALKATESWEPSSGPGTDLYGFRALATGYVSSLGGATGAGVIATFATTQVDDVGRTRTVANLYRDEQLAFEANGMQLGAGVRCIRDE